MTPASPDAAGPAVTAAVVRPAASGWVLGVSAVVLALALALAVLALQTVRGAPAGPPRLVPADAGAAVPAPSPAAPIPGVGRP